MQEIVSSEELGAWLLGIRVGANVRRLRQPVVDLLRRHRGRNGVAIFAADEAPEDMTDGDLRLLAELFDLGLASAMRRDEENELSIFRRSATHRRVTTASAPCCEPPWRRTWTSSVRPDLGRRIS